MFRIATVVTTLALTFGVAQMAQAQGIARTFDELHLLVRPGDRVTVRETSGETASGRLVRLSPGALTIMAGGAERELSERDIASVLQRRQDPLGNGARWGMGIALGLAGAAAVSIRCDGCGGALIAGGLFYGGLGAGIGAGVDALITAPEVIYERTPSAARVHVAPIAGGGRTGVALTVGF
jgi:hypothetical protein